MNLVYIGPHHPGVEVELPGGGSVFAERGGEPVEFPKELSDGLLEQESNWRKASAKESKSPSDQNQKPADAGEKEA